MSLGKASENHASPLATARYDARESAGVSDSASASQTASRFGLASILQVPVGYEDETGFHCGEPQFEDTAPVIDPEQFSSSTSGTSTSTGTNRQHF